MATERAASLLEAFGELVELDAGARAARLEALRVSEPGLAEALARMLAADAGADGVLDRSFAEVTPSAAAQVRGSETPQGAGGRRIGAFELVRLLGQGGMGEVWLAEREEGGFRQQVALKLLRRGMEHEDGLRRFVQERRILAELSHPDIARFIDGGLTDAGLPWYAMEFVDGVPITRFASERGLDVRARVALLQQVAAAVAYAQNRLVVHRDLKPSNILVDATGRPHLVDFGIAKLLEVEGVGSETATGLRAMSPAYAAPEQVLDQPVSAATDVYALGVVLFELLTGTLPHERAGSSLETLVDQVRGEVTERPSVRLRRLSRTEPGEAARRAPDLRGVDAELDLIVLTALRREPERRYANAAAFGDDLGLWLAGRPIAAQPDTARYRMRKFVSRHRLAVSSAAAVLVALMLGVGVALWQAHLARAEAARAEEQARRATAQARRAEAMKDFALGMFREQDPFARGRPVPRPASELVALGIARAEQRFADDAGTRNELLGDLAAIQLSLGEAAAAKGVLEVVVRERARVDGEKSIAHAIASTSLAAAEVALGEHAKALPRLEAAATTLTAGLGPEAPATLQSDARRAYSLSLAGRREEALALATDLVARNERAHGRDAIETLVQLSDLGSIQENLDRLDLAEATARDVVARLERSLGPEHALLVRPLARIGDVLRRRQQYPDADAIYVRAIDIARKHGTPVLVGTVLLRRGDLLRRMKRLDEAAVHLDEAASLLPPASGELAQTEMFRGGLLRAQGRLADGAQAFLRAHRVFLAALGEGSVFAWNAALEYASTERAAGRGAEAEPLLLQAEAALRRIAAPDSFDVMNAASTLAAWRAEQGRHAEAVPLWREAVEGAGRIYGATHATTQSGRIQLAASLVALGGEPALAEARAALEALGPISDTLPADMRARAEALARRLGRAPRAS